MLTKHTPIPIHRHVLEWRRTPKIQPSQLLAAFNQDAVYTVVRPDWYWKWVRRDKILIGSELDARIMSKVARLNDLIVLRCDHADELRVSKMDARKEHRRYMKAMKAR